MSAASVTKHCTMCGETKPLGEFYPRKGGLHGRQSRCKPCCAVATKASREKHIDAARERERAYHRNHRPEAAARLRAWRAANPEKASAHAAGWTARNPEKAADRDRRKREQRESAGAPGPGSRRWHAERLILLERDDGVCGICGEDVDPLKYVIDHIIPIAGGGVHAMHNLQVAHPRCNNRKYTAVAA